jgi:hypothetical protein
MNLLDASISNSASPRASAFPPHCFSPKAIDIDRELFNLTPEKATRPDRAFDKGSSSFCPHIFLPLLIKDKQTQKLVPFKKSIYLIRLPLMPVVHVV